MTNGTDARDIALHYIDLRKERTTPQIVKRTIGQAMTLLKSGYTKDEIIEVLDYVIIDKKVDMYSLGYLNASINDMIREVAVKKNNDSLIEDKQKLKALIEEEQAKMRDEVTACDESTERNREKARRNSPESRFGKKYSFDMFEG